MVEYTYAATTVMTPSSFGMPACGHASFVTPAQKSALTPAATVRPRVAGTGIEAGLAVSGGIETQNRGGVDFAQTRFGTTAWRPPTS